MIKFLVDENVGFTIVKYLRDQGFDTKFVSELFPSRDDIFIIERAYQEERIIVTNDKDFGYLIFKSNLSAPAIILLRFKDESPTLRGWNKISYRIITLKVFNNSQLFLSYMQVILFHPLKINAIKTILKLPEEKVLNHFIVAGENKIRIRPLKG